MREAVYAGIGSVPGEVPYFSIHVSYVKIHRFVQAGGHWQYLRFATDGRLLTGRALSGVPIELGAGLAGQPRERDLVADGIGTATDEG